MSFSFASAGQFFTSVIFVFVFMIQGCVSRKFSDLKSEGLQSSAQSVEKNNWSAAGVASYSEMMTLYGRESTDQRAVCEWYFLRDNVYLPLISAENKGREKIYQNIEKYQKGCFIKFSQSFDPRYYYKFRDAYNNSGSESEFLESIKLEMPGFRKIFSHPIKETPPMNKSYRIWLEKIRVAQVEVVPFFRKLQEFELDVLRRLVGDAQPSVHVRQTIKWKLNQSNPWSLDPETASASELFENGRLNPDELMGRTLETIFFEILDRDERAAGFFEPWQLHDAVNSEQFFQMIAKGHLPIDIVFGGSRLNIHPVQTHRMQWNAVYRLWKETGKTIKLGQSCNDFNFDEPQCPAHLYRWFGVIFLNDQIHIEMGPQYISAVGFENKNLWSPFFDIANQHSTHGFWSPEIFRGSLPSYLRAFGNAPTMGGPPGN